MATYTLPNGATWDSNINPADWQNSGSSDFWDNITETITPVLITENTINTSRSRITKSTWVDTSYTGSNYIVIKNTNYCHPAMSDQCFAVQHTSFQYKIESK